MTDERRQAVSLGPAGAHLVHTHQLALADPAQVAHQQGAAFVVTTPWPSGHQVSSPRGDSADATPRARAVRRARDLRECPAPVGGPESQEEHDVRWDRT